MSACVQNNTNHTIDIPSALLDSELSLVSSMGSTSLVTPSSLLVSVLSMDSPMGSLLVVLEGFCRRGQ